jgi:DNA sulfur modification protein DndB
MEPYSYEFTAIRGLQAGKAYFVAMCPLKLVPRLFRFDEEEVPAELRAQRVLNRARIPAIARYIADNAGEYILSSLCASVDGSLEFEPVAPDGPFRSVGKLRIGMSARIVINDGQHRRAAIEEALRERPYLGDETISVVIFADQGLERAQQMFADLNRHAIRPTQSLGVLYDHRDPLAQVTRRVVAAVPHFRDLVETEKTTISNRSLKLFTLSSIYQATAELLGKGKQDEVGDADEQFAATYWNTLGRHIPDWSLAAHRKVTPAELRRDYIHAHGIALQALGIVGAQARALHPAMWETKLRPLRRVDWSRTNRALWEGRAMIGGRLNKSRNNILLVANTLLRTIGLPLTAEGERVEALHATSPMTDPVSTPVAPTTAWRHA